MRDANPLPFPPPIPPVPPLPFPLLPVLLNSGLGVDRNCPAGFEEEPNFEVVPDVVEDCREPKVSRGNTV